MTRLVQTTNDALRDAGHKTVVTDYTLGHVGWREQEVQHGAVDGLDCIYIRADNGELTHLVTVEDLSDRTGGKFLYLGWGLRHRLPNKTGVRRAIWDAAFGYVNGWPLRDIAYYVWTRSLSEKRWKRRAA